jgi:hypothetical protein
LLTAAEYKEFMTMQISRQWIQSVFFAAAALSGLGERTARAEPDSGSLSVDIEIAEQSGQQPPEALLTTLVLFGEHGCASADARHAKVSYEVEVCRDGGERTSPVLRVNIARSASAAQPFSSKKFKVTSQLPVGQRALLGRLHYSDGIETQLTAAVR